MSDFTPRDCAECGREIASRSALETLGENSLHKGCVKRFVDRRPAIDYMPYTCEDCYQSFWTERGLEYHRERNHAGAEA